MPYEIVWIIYMTFDLHDCDYWKKDGIKDIDMFYAGIKRAN